MAVTGLDLYVVVSQSLQVSPGTFGEGVDDLDGAHLSHQFCEHRGLIAAAAADLQHAIFRLGLKLGGHESHDEGLGNSLAMADG